MLNDESRKIKLESIKIKMRRCPIDKESIRFPDLVRQIAVNDTVYGWKFKLETRRDRPLDRTYDPTPFRLSRGRTPASSAPRLYIRPELFIVEGAERTRAPLINGEARHTRSRTTRGGGVGRVRTRVRTDIVSRWRIIWRSFSRRFLGVTHTQTQREIKGVSLLTYRGMYPRPGNLAVFPGNATGVLILCVNVPFDFSILQCNFYKFDSIWKWRIKWD